MIKHGKQDCDGCIHNNGGHNRGGVYVGSHGGPVARTVPPMLMATAGVREIAQIIEAVPGAVVAAMAPMLSVTSYAIATMM